jgi:hypothetical protein
MKDNKNAYSVLVGKPEAKRKQGMAGSSLKWSLNERI